MTPDTFSLAALALIAVALLLGTAVRRSRRRRVSHVVVREYVARIKASRAGGR